MKRLFIALLAVISVLAANAQRLNEFGQKMVKSVHCRGYYYLYFDYDTSNHLVGVTLESDPKWTTTSKFKYVYRRSNGKITAKIYNGPKLDKDCEEKITLNSKGKISKIVQYEYSSLPSIARSEIMVHYNDSNVPTEVITRNSMKERNDPYYYDPEYLRWRFIHDDFGGLFIERTTFYMKDEDKRKCNGICTEDKYFKYLNNFTYLPPYYDMKKFEFAEIDPNDTNISLLALFFVSDLNELHRNILLYTEWAGIREDNLLYSMKFNVRGRYEFAYRYDEKMNIYKIEQFLGNGCIDTYDITYVE